MYPLIRFLTTSASSLLAGSMGFDEACETSFRCRPWDVDMFLEVNNGRILTLYDLGRFDLAIRTGLAKTLKQRRWGLVVAGSTVMYRRRVRMFDKVTIRTRVAGFDQRWIYIVQSMWVKDDPASSVLLRTGITSKGKIVPVGEVVKALSIEGWNPEPAGWIKEWIRSEEHRVWPPQ